MQNPKFDNPVIMSKTTAQDLYSKGWRDLAQHITKDIRKAFHPKEPEMHDFITIHALTDSIQAFLKDKHTGDFADVIIKPPKGV